MEFKKKTIIWEDNNEPPKDYLGVKSDGKVYEYSYVSKKGVESKSISGSGNCEPVEANPTIEDGDVTTPLNALKVGESVYTVGGDSDSDIQIVELTYDHIPATGTLSASDLAKLDSDNCLLVMKGKYFRKTFSSDGGIDYKEIGLATVLGGVRSIYFTASKPDGEYTIAYTHPIEANTQTQATTALENIKVGNTTYSVPLSPMTVHGTVDEDYHFTPNSGEPSFKEAKAHFFNGGIVMAMYTVQIPSGKGQGLSIISNYNAIRNSEGFWWRSGGVEMFWSPAVEPDMTIDINLYGDNYYYYYHTDYNFVELDESDVEEANAVMVNAHKLDIQNPDSYILTRVTDGHDTALFRYTDADDYVEIVTKDEFESSGQVQVPEGVITNDYNYVVITGHQAS